MNHRRVDPSAYREPELGSDLYIGIDIGTSGCRVAAIDDSEMVVASASSPFPPSAIDGDCVTQQPQDWWRALEHSLMELLQQIDANKVVAIAVDGTSSTILLSDAAGNPVTPGFMYNDSRARDEANEIASRCPADSGALGATSGLAKLMWIRRHDLDKQARHVLSQADWIAARLCGVYGHTDWNNALKLGFDAVEKKWPDWIGNLAIRHDLLPEVHGPGEVLGAMSPDMANHFKLPAKTLVKLGTTDSIAAFIAAGADRPGQAVTSLGSTLVLKLLTTKPVFSSEHGVYSHRLGNSWLAGGASNSGGAVLLQHFSLEQIQRMTPMLQPGTPVGLDYYPLPHTGERFPINDANLPCRIEPRPADPVQFFQALLEGIASIEHQGYQLLQRLGAGYPDEVITCGGGAINPAWSVIRQHLLGVPVRTARSADAAVGAAKLARGHFEL
ncbi:MAG: FGGY-family carbohydrate kinase [Acidiferrobacterales bacterium]